MAVPSMDSLPSLWQDELREGATIPQGNGHGASSSQNPVSPPRWYNGCYMKYRTGICKGRNCAYFHDLDEGEIAAFMSWTDISHVFFSSETSDCDDCHLEGNDTADETVGHIARRAPIDTILSASSCPDGLWYLRHHGHHPLLSAFGSDARHQQPPAAKEDGSSKAKVRPSLGNRIRYRKHVSMVMEQILADPCGWSVDTMQIPIFIQRNPKLERKFMARIAAFAEHVSSKARANARSAAGTKGDVAFRNEEYLQ
mmetsp:Transcript_613/g.1133  ORF Transcript_613/g.1133 Transcript_613/m.1133 type:complete len:255 (-) Transcript_613:30-794(-)